MGGGISKVGVEHQPNDKRASNQDLARSYVSKVGAIRMILKNSESKTVFVNFMTDNETYSPSLHYLNYYFDIEGVLNTLPELVVQHAIDLIEKHKKNASSLGSEISKNIVSSLGKLGKVEVKSLSIPEIMHYLSKSQGETFGLLTPSFDAFQLSDAYKNWRANEEQVEKVALLNRRSNSAVDMVRLPSCKDIFPYILIVDDSTITAKIASFSLQRDGHTVDVAKDGSSALELMKTKAYDLVVIELDVPRMNAFELAKAYRKLEVDMLVPEVIMDLPTKDMDGSARSTGSTRSTVQRKSSKSAQIWMALSMQKTQVKRTKKLVIIGMSTRSDDSTPTRVLDAGMDAFMVKPFNINHFLEVVTELQTVQTPEAQPVLDKTSSPRGFSRVGGTATANDAEHGPIMVTVAMEHQGSETNQRTD